MSQIAILLSTYNSFSFLNELIDSLLKQTYENWTLYIIDDGSVDNTVELLNKYRNEFDNIVLIENPQLHNGPKNNFMYLLSIIEADYYMFCDHDDVWLPHKIERSMEQMLALELGKKITPIIIHSNLFVVDAKLNLIDNSFFKYASVYPKILLSSINHLAHSNCVTGCTMLFNHRVKQIAFPLSKHALMHDSWISLKTLAAHGIIYCIEEPLILYRQHSNNTLGANKKQFSFNVLKSLKSNWKQFKMARDVTKIGVLKFVFYRIIYLYKIS